MMQVSGAAAEFQLNLGTLKAIWVFLFFVFVQFATSYNHLSPSPIQT